MLLNVENVTTAKTGKSLRVKAGGEWYGAKKDSGITAGMTIDAEVEDGDFGKWITKYKASGSNGGSQNAAQRPSTSSSSSSSGGVASAPVWSNFVSNQVAHAIQSGQITSPDQIKVWAAAAKQAFIELL